MLASHGYVWGIGSCLLPWQSLGSDLMSFGCMSPHTSHQPFRLHIQVTAQPSNSHGSLFLRDTAKFHAFHNLDSWPQSVSVLIYTQLLCPYILHTSFLQCMYGVKVNVCCHGVLRIRLVEFQLSGPDIPRISPLGSTYRCRTHFTTV